MGSIPQLSVLKGPTRHLHPNLLNTIFENAATGAALSNKALIFEDNGGTREHTYDELNKFTNKLARTINQIIVSNNLPRNNDGDYVVAVKMHPSDHLVMTLLAIWKAGAAYLPLDHAFPGSRIEHIVKEAKPVMVIYDEDSSHFLDTFKLSFDSLVKRSSNQSEETLRDHEKLYHIKDDLAIILYTSGSTGVPKGVRLPHKVILNRLHWQFKRFPYTSTERVCVFKTALTFVDSVSELWGPLMNGLTVLIVPKALTKDAEKLVNVMENYKIERLVLVPSLLRSLLLYLELQKNRSLLRSLRLWVCSGETLAVSLAADFFKYFQENHHVLCNFYGSTEIMGDVTFYVVSNLDQLKHHEKVPIGYPVDNTAIYLLDKDLRPVTSGAMGELFAGGLNVAAGYVNGRDPDKFLDNPLTVDPSFGRLYRTGDYARLNNGVLLYEGRLDSQVKIRGHRVDLSEIEKAVNELEGVNKGVVLCYKAGEMDQALLAFVTTSTIMSEHQIETILKEKLTSYMVPQVILLETIPLLVNGKTDRQALLKFYENTNNNEDSVPEIEINYDGINPHQLETAKVLLETVGSVLGRSARSAITVNSNFYEIGGNSLNSIYTISKLNELGYHISIGDFISAMDLGEVLIRMNRDSRIDTKPPSYSSELLKPGYKKAVTEMITTSFYEKADLEQWIISEINIPDYTELVDALWEPLLEKNLSFIAKSETGKIVGVALNFDARDEPEVIIKSKLNIVFEFLESIEGPVRDNQLPPGKGTVLHSFMMGTHSSLSPKENVAIMQFMEEETLNLAKRRNFSGIFTTNTNPLTQQLGTSVYKFETLLDYQVNQYVASDNTKPFGRAPDDQRALVQWKPI